MNTNRVKIEKMVNGGYGLGRLENGQVIMLRNGLTGEDVQYKVNEKQKKLVFGTVDSVFLPSNSRIEPPCPYYVKCGGCDLQHCNYQGQQKIKNSILEELLADIPGSLNVLRKIVPSPEPFGYRQRIRLKVQSQKIGFLRFHSSEIVPIKACLLANPFINEVLAQTQTTKELLKLCDHSEEIEYLYNPKTSQVSILLHYTRKPRPADIGLAEKVVAKTSQLDRFFFTGAAFPLVGPLGVDIKTNESKIFSHRVTVEPPARSFELAWEAGGFCQVNLLQNSNMINYVFKNCGELSNTSILDLFCGMGNFSIPLAESSASLLGIEGQGSAIRCARLNADSANLKNTEFIKSPIEKFCKKLVEGNEQFDIIVLDPPRQGIPALARDISSLASEKIIYISCDPATLRRDLFDFCEKGFHLTEIQPFDMFPQTHHIETVAILSKD